MKKLFNNLPWKEWPTRKISFTMVSLLWFAYAIAGMFGIEPNETITELIVYNGGKWILTFGIILVLSDKAGKKLLQLFGDKKNNLYQIEEDEEYDDGDEE